MTLNLVQTLIESMHSTRRHRLRQVRKASFKAYGNYLILAYIFIKCLYLLNVVVQFLILDKFLGINYHGYGFYILKRIVNGDSWQTSDRFPRVTLCNMWIRVLGHVQRYTIQCSLPMNLVNEIIFTFIWFWLIFVFMATFYSLAKWTVIGIYKGGQVDYTIARLAVMNMFDKNRDKNLELDENTVADFVHKFLERDGFLIIRLVSHNTTDITASELLYRLWEYYLQNRETINNVYEQSREGKGLSKERSGLMHLFRPLRRGISETESAMEGTELKKRRLESGDESSNETIESDVTVGSIPSTAPLTCWKDY